MAKAKKGSKSKPRERRERHFIPRSTTSLALVYGLGGVGSLLLGAGAWGASFGPSVPAKVAGAAADAAVDAANTQLVTPSYVWWLLAAGAALVGIAIWIGTSGEAPLRVGDAGVGIDKGTVRRLAWNTITRIAWDGGAQMLLVHGVDDMSAEHTLRISLQSQPQAIAWIVKEARARVPSVVELSDEEATKIPEARKDGGAIIPLEPLRVVGKHCAASGKVISYEPDARVCPRCERVYYRTEVPETCACGGSLAAIRDGSKDAAVDADAKTDESAPSTASDQA